MTRKPNKTMVRVGQPMPEELVAKLVDFVSRKFYAGHPDTFAKHRRDLLQWVILWPAKWLYNRGVTLPGKRYEEILTGILMDALANGDFSNIKYLPGYLKVCVEDHFRHHGEDYYDEGKALRNVVQQAVAIAGASVKREDDVVTGMVNLSKLLKATKGKAKPSPIVGKQKELFG